MKRFLVAGLALLMLEVNLGYAKGPMGGGAGKGYMGAQGGAGIQQQDRQRIHAPGTGLNSGSALREQDRLKTQDRIREQDRLRQRIHTPGTGQSQTNQN